MLFIFLTGLLALTFIAAITDWVAVHKGWRKVEIIAKPATMVFLFAWMAYTARFEHIALVFFGLGILFSLAGDVFLMLSDRWFIAGLVSFLMAHVMYIIGFYMPLPELSPLWALALAVILGLGAAQVLGGIVNGLRAKSLQKLVTPVVIYGIIITLMLLSALLTLSRPDWQLLTAILVSLGALAFYISDVILAWNKFVKPIKNGRIMNMAAYHIGQIALIIGVVYQFGPYLR